MFVIYEKIRGIFMKKIMCGVASLTLTTLLLTGCSETKESSGEEAKGKTEQSATSKEKKKPSKIIPGVQFMYNGNEITDEDLEKYKAEFLSGLQKEEYKKLDIESVATNYILVHELLKEFGSSEEELRNGYDEYEQTVDTEYNSVQSITLFTPKFISEKIINRDVSSIDTQRKLYDNLDPIWKDDISFKEFQSDKKLLFKEALDKKVIDIGEIQQEAIEEADVKNVNLKVNKKIEPGEYLPFSQIF